MNNFTRLGRNSLPCPRGFFEILPCYHSAIARPRFIPSRLDSVEYVEEYHPGGLPPISIGDTFASGRFKVLHKLGFGGSSTIWMARDQQGPSTGRLVTLKAMRADALSKNILDIPELSIPKILHTIHASSPYLQTIDDHSIVESPNGAHPFLVFPLLGPSVLAMSDSPGRVSGSRRLRGDLARRVAKQTAMAIYHMHCAGIVHGDITTSNILFRVSDHVPGWSDDHIYAYLGSPETEHVRTRGGESLGPHVPVKLVGAVDNSSLQNSSLLQDNVVVTDFGQSYIIASPPDYQPGTAIHYQSPEARFEGRTGVETDVWALGCAIFEIRAGSPLFEPFLSSETEILRQTAELLGRLPEPWWSSFEERGLWFEEDGALKSAEDQELAGVLLRSSKSSLRTRLRAIGTSDDPPISSEGPMIEMSGVGLSEKEVELLGDLLEKMLRYPPEERIGMREVIEHPWFKM